jgi:tetratricopeptide (TPR) repeat protein
MARPHKPQSGRSVKPKPAPAPVVAAPPPPFWRDPWAWASAVSVLPLLIKSLGAPLGEPVAEDFDFLHRALLEGRHTFLDGGGSMAFWRPLAHQAYYQALGPLLVRAPGAVAVIHVVLFALAAFLLYRTLRLRWSGPCAAAAASFPLLAESTRTLISWPSHFVDLGLFLFSVLALHEAARRRLPTALASLLAALLCKEIAVVTGLLLPWMPEPRDRRGRWVVATGALMAAWVLVYLAIRRHAGLALPHQLESAARLAAAPLSARFTWATLNSARAIFDLTLLPGPLDLAVSIAVVALASVTLYAFATKRKARERLAVRLPWVGWGLGWFVLASLTLMTIHPLWAPNRSQFGSLGLGIALVAALDAAHPALLGTLVALRLALLGLSPGPPAIVTDVAPDHGAFMDFDRLVRLQRLMLATRTALRQRFPALPRGGAIAHHHVPNSTLYAFGGSNALQVWYGDTTLVWEPLDAAVVPVVRPALATAEFEPSGPRQVVLVDPEALDHLSSSLRRITAEDWQGALADLTLADSAQADTTARVFRAQVAGKRALILLQLGSEAEAERNARHAQALWRDGIDARLVEAVLEARRGRYDEADAELDTLLLYYPGDTNGLALRDQIRAARRGRSPFRTPSRP